MPRGRRLPTRPAGRRVRRGVSGLLFALLHAVLSITFKVNQVISGTVINILAIG